MEEHRHPLKALAHTDAMVAPAFESALLKVRFDGTCPKSPEYGSRSSKCNLHADVTPDRWHRFQILWYHSVSVLVRIYRRGDGGIWLFEGLVVWYVEKVLSFSYECRAPVACLWTTLIYGKIPPSCPVTDDTTKVHEMLYRKNWKIPEVIQQTF